MLRASPANRWRWGKRLWLTHVKVKEWCCRSWADESASKRIKTNKHNAMEAAREPNNTKGPLQSLTTLSLVKLYHGLASHRFKTEYVRSFIQCGWHSCRAASLNTAAETLVRGAIRA